MGRLRKGQRPKPALRVELVVAIVEDILRGDAGYKMALALGMEEVVDVLVFQRDFDRSALLARELVGQAGRDLGREAVVGVRVFVDGAEPREEFRIRPDDAGLLEQDRGIVVELADILDILVADAADRAFDAQRLGAAEEVAVAPIAFDAQPLGAGNGCADTVVTQLALADLDLDRDLAACVERRPFPVSSRWRRRRAPAAGRAPLPSPSANTAFLP